MRKCVFCRQEKDRQQLLGIYCLRCEKIAGDESADLAHAFEQRDFFALRGDRR